MLAFVMELVAAVVLGLLILSIPAYIFCYFVARGIRDGAIPRVKAQPEQTKSKTGIQTLEFKG